MELNKVLRLMVSLGFVMTTSAHAGSVVVSKRTVTLPVDVSTAKVKLSNSGYVTAVVKVLVPELADVTILNHRNAGEEAPCLATYSANTAEELVQNRPGIENVDFEIMLVRETYPDKNTGLCKVTLREEINGSIRGMLFSHDRSDNVADREMADCR